MTIAGPAMAALAPPLAGVAAGFLILAASVWTGGLVAIFVAARVAQRTLDPGMRVAFFRGLGRAYGPVGGAALAVALGCGAALVSDRAWSGPLVAAAALAAGLVAVTGTGVVQARRMTRLRQAALGRGGNPRLAAAVRRGARRAAALRGAIALLTLALVAVAALLVT